jgi:hypothetical protein
MTVDFLGRLYICGIIAIGVLLFLAVDELEPNPRLAAVFKCAILATGGGAIANQLLS